MAYLAPIGTTKLVDGATVNNGAYSTAALVPLTSPRSPVIWYVSCDQAHDLDFGVVAKSTTTAAELDRDVDACRTGLPALATYGTRKYTYWPDAAAGYAWCRVKNVSGGAAATVTVYGGQL